MKEPKLVNLKLDPVETRKVRKVAAKPKTIKITINLDAKSLASLKREAARTGVPYQRLLNQLLSDTLQKKASDESRLARLEREVANIKKRFAA